MPVAVRLQRIIWAALLVSIAIYLQIVLLVGRKNATKPFASEFQDPLVPMLYLLAALMFVAALFTRGWMRSHNRPVHLYNIVSWALFEAVTIYGVVLAFLTSDWRLVLGPVLLTIAGFVITFPRET